jgi:hypothetical protein
MDLFTANMMMGFGSAIAQIGQANGDRIRANAQAALDDYLADVEQDNALKEAAIIRKSGRKAQGAANAAYAAAGVQVGEGSALETERQIGLDVEHDAQQALVEGDSRARGLRTEGKMARIAGKQAMTAAYVGAVGTVLGSAAQGYRSGWKTGSSVPAGNYSGTQAPAPVVDRSTYSSGWDAMLGVK